MKPRNPSADYRVVYSTDPADDPSSEQSGDSRNDSREPAPPPHEQTVKLRLEKQGRAGKSVTVVTGIEGSAEVLRAIAKDLKTACGAGGTLRLEAAAAVIEVQGDHRAKVEAHLVRLGYKVRRAGG